MIISVDISLYPLDPDYSKPIIDFIRELKNHPEIRVATNPLATQLSGDYDVIMHVLTEAMRPVLAGAVTCSFVLKILNVEIVPGEVVEV